MTGKHDRPEQATALRRQAEEIARARVAPQQEDLDDLSPAEARRMLHELRVHQIELEMQNEELRRTQADLDVSRARYFDLYDRAPVGYCTLGEQGVILEANLTAATLLGVTRGTLVKRSLTRFILEEDQALYVLLRKQLSATGEPQACELRMVTRGGTAFWAHLATTAAQDGDGAPVCRVVLSDVSERRKGEEVLLESRNELHRLSAQLLTAQEAERGQLARELHDGICQTLNAIKFTLEAALHAKGPAQDRLGTLGLLVPTIQDAIEEVRALFTALRPPTLDELGLAATISWFAREFQAAFRGIRVVFRAEVDEHDIPRSLRTVMFRFFQEAMNNVSKHSGADEVVVSLRKSDGMLEFAVEDNGCGFDSEAPWAGEDEQRGCGLGCMRERIELAGGSFAVQSLKGEGTAVRARWPLAAEPSG